MFSCSGRFSSVPCPLRETCRRRQCLFSHAPDAKQQGIPRIPVSAPARPSAHQSSSSKHVQAASSSISRPSNVSTVPSKRPGGTVTQLTASSGTAHASEPPRKLQRLNKASASTSAASTQTTGVPVLRINAALSKVPIPVRQAMVKTLYDAFASLYSDILASHPTLASEHALSQESEVYEKSTKLTYRNAVISSVVTLKKRPKPKSINDSSVGTADTLQRRRDEFDKLQSLKLATKHLERLVMSVEDLQKWGFMTELPDGPGSTNPSDEGKPRQCERCAKYFIVKKREEVEECKFHWGRQQSVRAAGEKIKLWSCCSQPTSEGGCTRGPHVFSESEPDELHARHAFSWTRPPSSEGDTALDVVALDCEMIYTTGGVRVARVSVVDGSGKEIFDEHVKMDDGVEVVDFNTRFSGITDKDYEKAILPLASIRRSLDAFINSDTIIVGHSLENDLKTLRIVHHRCVDTAVLFPHKAGPPFRRSLRDLTRENLGRMIQTGGGSSGHSSVEDSVATLDLVRWFVLNKTDGKKSTASIKKDGPSRETTDAAVKGSLLHSKNYLGTVGGTTGKLGGM